MLQVLVGLRSGAMLRAALQPAPGATGQPPNVVDMDAEAVPGGDANMADAEGTEASQPQQPINFVDSFQLKQVPIVDALSGDACQADLCCKSI